MNPRTLAKFRDAFAPSGAKDDPGDAPLALELVSKHREKLRPWRPADAQTRTLPCLGEQRRTLVHDRTRLLNRLTSVLKGDCPHVGAWFDALDTKVVYEFLKHWPTLEAVQQVADETGWRLFPTHHAKRRAINQRRIDERRQAIAATTDRAVLTSSVMVVHALREQGRGLSDAVNRVDQHIAELTQAHVDVAICASWPGAGPVHTSRFISAGGTDRSRDETVEELLTCIGIAPVIERSGRTPITHVRWFCPKFLRQSFHAFAGQSIRDSGWAKAYYTQQRTRGNTHQAAVRALAFQWVRMIFRCWKNHTPYKELISLTALQQRGSSRLKLISENPV